MDFKRLSSPIADVKSHYDVVVIGSGYGASIAASRMSRAGKKVAMLEQGKEFIPGEYPRTLAEADKEMQVNTPKEHIGSNTGLYDFHVNEDISVFKGCGLGGTSLVNANVALPPEERVMESERWPAAFRADMPLFKRNLNRAWNMLQPNPFPEGQNGYGKLPKSEAMKKSAAGMGAPFRYTDINVHFEDKVNSAGVQQYKCSCCGDCMTGCNYGAKNTTIMNYIPDARNHGAEIFTMVAVSHVSKSDNGMWVVHYKIQNAESEKFKAPALFVTADMVILGAGSLGSTEILLRSKSNGLSVSDMTGAGFTGNGDVLGFSYNSDVEINTVGYGAHKPGEIAPVGPCITSVIDLRNQPVLEDGMVIEDGNVPGPMAGIASGTFLGIADTFGEGHKSFLETTKEKTRELLGSLEGAYRGPMNKTQAFLVMTHDNGNGRMLLENDRLKIEWPGMGKEPIFEKVDANLKKATAAIGGTYVPNPAWTKLMNYSLATVHPLGGCMMADDATGGVVNHKGEVFSGASGTDVHKGLYVCDGAVIPLPLGVNPLITISAVAERTCELIAQDQGLTINYDYTAFNQGDASTIKPGVQFTETMKGFWSANEKDDFQKGADAGKASGSSLEFTLTMISDNVDEIVKTTGHTAALAGVVEAPALSSKPLTISDGVFNLFVDDTTAAAPTKLMKYSMVMNTEESKQYFFYGYKVVCDTDGLDKLWRDTSTLFITIHNGADEQSPVLGKGILVIEMNDFMTQMTTMKALNVSSTVQQLEVMTEFGKYFSGALFEIYIKDKLSAKI